MFWETSQANKKLKGKNMKDIKLIVDGASDLTEDEYIKYDIEKIDFLVYEQAFPDINIDNADRLYQKMMENPKNKFKTACPSSEEYFKAFERAHNQGKDIICMTITSKFSGSFNSALVGKDKLLEVYPDAKIEVVDSSCNAVCYSMLVLSVANMIEDGFTVNEIMTKINILKQRNETDFVVGNLNYLRAGGRIGKLASIAAKTLNIKPIIVMKNGDISSGGLTIGLTSALSKAIGLVKKYFAKINEKISSYFFMIGYGNDKQLGEKFLNQVKTQLDISAGDITLRQIGATTGVHTGPVVVGVGFMKKYSRI